MGNALGSPIIPLEYPRFGFIRLDSYDQVLVDVRAQMTTGNRPGRGSQEPNFVLRFASVSQIGRSWVSVL